MTLGRHSYCLGTDHAGDTIIGNFSSVAGGVEFEGPDNHACIRDPKIVACFDLYKIHGINSENYPPSGFSKGTIKVGHDVWIGEDAQILSGVKIHNGAIVGTQAVVTRNVPPYAVVAGNPATIRKFRFDHETIHKLLTIQWWGWEDEQIRQNIVYFKDIKKFVDKFAEGGEMTI